MSAIVIFGAGGKAGRRAVAEAVARGHRVTAVVRDPATTLATLAAELSGPDVAVVAGDVTSADSVAEVAAGHNAAINAAVRLDVPSEQFFPMAARALVDGLGRAGVGRLVGIGIGTVLETAPSMAVHDTPGFPAEHRAFSLGHSAQLSVLRAADTKIDWLVIAPPPTMLDNEATRTGTYRSGDHRVLPMADDAPLMSYADLAVALIDEIETPKHHRTLIAVAPTP